MIKRETGTHTSSADSPAKSSSSGSGDSGWSSSFVGSTPSTVLFFLALAAGVFIALLFIFFTIRYFVRSKYGLHIYPMSHRNVFLANLSMPGHVTPRTNNQELQEQLVYIRDHHSVRSDLLERMIRNRRRRRRRSEERYTRMARLTQEEVDTLFPKQSYECWLNGGKERDQENRDGVIQEEPDIFNPAKGDAFDDNYVDKSNSADVTNMGANLEASSSSSVDASAQNRKTMVGEEIELERLDESDGTSSGHEGKDLHFTSGFCSICLDSLSENDMVRGLLCGHVFHSDCLDPWLINRKACCPLCKRNYYRECNHRTDEDGNTGNEQGGDSNQANNSDQDAEAPRQSTDNRSLINLEIFRSDPSLMAMIQELIPNSERVRMIVNERETQHLRIGENASEIADQKYNNCFKRLWWKVMGIKKVDIYNWAVIRLYHEHFESRQNQQGSTPSNAEAQNSDTQNNDNQNSQPSSAPDDPTHLASSLSESPREGSSSSHQGLANSPRTHEHDYDHHETTPEEIAQQEQLENPTVTPIQSPYEASSPDNHSERDIVHQRV